jgi:hypothetical protein
MLRNEEALSNFGQRLAQEVERLTERAKSTPEGNERETIFRKARQLDVIAHLNGSMAEEP